MVNDRSLTTDRVGCTNQIENIHYQYHFTTSRTLKPLSYIGDQLHRLKRHLMVAIGLPTLIVSFTLAIDVHQSSAVGYGQGGACWILNNSARVFTYVAPVIICTILQILSLGEFMFI